MAHILHPKRLTEAQSNPSMPVVSDHLRFKATGGTGHRFSTAKVRESRAGTTPGLNPMLLRSVWHTAILYLPIMEADQEPLVELFHFCFKAVYTTGY